MLTHLDALAELHEQIGLSLFAHSDASVADLELDGPLKANDMLVLNVNQVFVPHSEPNVAFLSKLGCVLDQVD